MLRSDHKTHPKFESIYLCKISRLIVRKILSNSLIIYLLLKTVQSFQMIYDNVRQYQQLPLITKQIPSNLWI